MQVSTITRSWVVRAIITSIVLWEFSLVFVWSDAQTPDTTTRDQSQLQLLSSTPDQGLQTNSSVANSNLWTDSSSGSNSSAGRESNSTQEPSTIVSEGSASGENVPADTQEAASPTLSVVTASSVIVGGLKGEAPDKEAEETNSTRDTFANELNPALNESAETMLQTFLDNNGPSILGIPELVCLGWHQTGGCSPDGPRDVQNDAGCSVSIQAGTSGYCLMRHGRSGEKVRVMRVGCSSLRDKVAFSCDDAADFARVAPQIDALKKAKQHEASQAQVRGEEVEFEPTKGIVLVMYPKLLSSVYATIRLIRSYECFLPVELWYLESEMGANPLEGSVILQSIVSDYGPISLHGIANEYVRGFMTKIHALAHSELDQVLFLDADNVPVKDPTFLFTTPEFKKTGAIFWPDFWHPGNTIFNIKAESLLWELIDMPFVNMFEQESGQLLVDRRRAAVALEIVQLLALRQPNRFELLNLLYGDKDLFRMAWLKTNTPFHMIGTPAAAAGMVSANQFCGMTMVQHDTQGEVLFLHHNGKKLIGDADQRHVWTHLQSFVFPEHLAALSADATERYAYMADNYLVGIYGASDAFPGLSMCYRVKTEYYRLTPWETLPWHDIEQRLHEFVQEASNLEQ
ncbi:hypothetical protein PHYPSEUDO_005791 [Phytophthora pseudosyringae]|uniref:Nucleotide-diphospho-sugar transferase n=1 Tax=Phytophthora pseudosyringae TaxID=221518 RepID=A0A8T1VNJ7_9STRA|nr:hypothetical protein PHYPSEUDO_005791 [Phytophthora pseudosyringae]